MAYSSSLFPSPFFSTDSSLFEVEVTRDEFHSFHKIDRDLFTRLVFVLKPIVSSDCVSPRGRATWLRTQLGRVSCLITRHVNRRGGQRSRCVSKYLTQPRLLKLRPP
uniref:Uncharacterized protein n=1 Tax=Brassica oleracea TaxID=3712 RepID=A0A3P6FQ67_BRAOL|nr:unnamed protein product [Brassica oleracea]